jgi:hypothetical protein
MKVEEMRVFEAVSVDAWGHTRKGDVTPWKLMAELCERLERLEQAIRGAEDRRGERVTYVVASS